MKLKILMAPEGAVAAAGTTVLTGEGATGTGEAKGAAGGTGDGSTSTAVAGTQGTAATVAAVTTTPPEGGTQGEPAKATEAVAADIQIKVPEGVAVDQALLDGFKAFAKENKITSEAAQKLVDTYIARQNETVQAAQDRQLEQITQWAEEARADKEIGGDHFGVNLVAGKKALARFGNPDLVKVLNETGLGNHKAVIRFMAQVGKQISEDKLPGTGTDESEGGPVEPAVLMYPSMQSK